MDEIIENPYKTPAADLASTDNDKSILQFKRFSAWGVFGLSVITLGIYPIYWLYTRAQVVNSNHEKQISSALLMSMVLVTILSFASSFFGEGNIALIVGLVVAIAYMVIYILVLFKVRNRLVDIMNKSCTSVYKLGPVLTFFFFSIYLQYKLNQCIDECS